MTFSSTIPFKPFSKKQRDYILAAEKNTFNFAEGAVRSGKTVCNVVAFALALNKSPDRLHLATGVTLAAACLNIGDCNGFGLEHLFRGRCRWGKYRNNTCLYVKCDSGEKIVIFAGGGKSDSYKKIRGNSYGMWIATEINKHYLSQGDDCFIKEAFNRQLAAANRKVFWDLNPDYPTHPVYTEYIDKYRTLGIDVNYRLFTMKDNLAISEKRRQEIERQYDKDSVWYKRSVLGQRIAAEGLIFGAFAAAPEKWKRKTVPENGEFITIGCDYGGNLSKTVFVATLILKNMRGVCVLEAKKLEGKKGEISPDTVEREFISFYRKVSEKYSYPVRYAFMDSEGQYLTNGIVSACRREGIKLPIGDSKKVKITDRIACKAKMLSERRWSVCEWCDGVILSTSQLLWDPRHPDRRLDDGTVDVDTADAEEYSWERFMAGLQ